MAARRGQHGGGREEPAAGGSPETWGHPWPRGHRDTHFQSPTGEKICGKTELSRCLSPRRSLCGSGLQHGLEPPNGARAVKGGMAVPGEASALSLQAVWMAVVFHCLGDCLNIVKALNWQRAICSVLRGDVSPNTAGE